MENVKCYKGFDRKMKCLNKQYKDGGTYIESGINLYERGMMHYCHNPFSVLDSYKLADDKGGLNTFAEVEPLSTEKTDDRETFASNALKISKKLSVSDFINTCIDYSTDKTQKEKEEARSRIQTTSCEEWERINSHIDKEKIKSSGSFVNIIASGNHSRVVSHGERARINLSGSHVMAGSSGAHAEIATTGKAHIGSSGFDAQISSSGDCAFIVSSGRMAQISSSGLSAQIGTLGKVARIASSGDDATIVSLGSKTQIASSGDVAHIISFGSCASIVSSGDNAKIESMGENNTVLCYGNKCKIKAIIGTWITIAENRSSKTGNARIPACIKTIYIDGVKYRECIWYTLKDGKLIEEVD